MHVICGGGYMCHKAGARSVHSMQSMHVCVCVCVFVCVCVCDICSYAYALICILVCVCMRVSVSRIYISHDSHMHAQT